MKNYRQFLKELPSSTVVFAFGRFNPPTVGHELLVKAVKKVALNNKADHAIYASYSEESKKNPLSVDKKIHYLNLMFPNINFVAGSNEQRTLIEAVKALNVKYDSLIMVVGTDQTSSYESLLNTHNGVDYNFDSIQVISAGDRDPDADDISSKMRSLASKGDYSQFKKSLPSSLRDIDGKRLMNDVRSGMGLDQIKEHIKFDVDNIREQYFRGEIFKEGEIVESNSTVYKIVKRGSNHLLLQCEDGSKVNKWIQDVNTTTREFMLNEDLTSKTLKPATDKIKVARMIATIVGMENAESMSNPEQLVNAALRKLKSKALNSDSIKIVDKMLLLADEVGIKYDSALKPQKLKEEAEQIDELKTSTLKSYSAKAAKSNLTSLLKPGEAAKKTAIKRFSGMMKAGEKIAKKEVREAVNYKTVLPKDPAVDDTEASDQVSQNAQDAANLLQPHTVIGHSMHDPAHGDQHRRRKIKYHLGEDIDEAKSKVKKQLVVKDDSQQLGSNNSKGFDAFFEEDERNAIDMSKYENEEDYQEMSEEDLDKMVDEINDWEDIIDAYDDEELAYIDADTGEEIEEDEPVNEEALNEVLSRIERMKAKIRFGRTKAKRERAVKIALKRSSSTKTINKRARRLAVSLMKKRLLRGRDPSKVSVGEKERIERAISKRKAVLPRLAMKLSSRVRQIEKARLSHKKFTKAAPAVAM